MQAKKKICDSCSQPKYIWKNYQGERFCQQCWMKHPMCSVPAKPTVKQKSISPRSSKKIKQDGEYSLLRKSYLNDHPMCEAGLQGCQGQASDIHHTFWGSDRSKYYLDITTWKSVCRHCHEVIHDKLSSDEAIQLGLKNHKKE